MKLSKILVYALAMGTVTFAVSKVQAVPCEVTISAKASYQDYKNGDGIIKKHSISQKMILEMLAQATGDSSITNKKTKTKLIYDPDAFNYWSYDSYEDYYSYGVFYYTNSTTATNVGSVGGMMPLQGYDEEGDYWSYIELDTLALRNMWVEEVLGFAMPYSSEANYVYKESKNKGTINGSALLYVHNNPNYFDITGANNYYAESSLYYANNYYGIYNSFSLVIHGSIAFDGSDDGTKVTEKFTLEGTGDGMYYDSDSGYHPLVISSGKATAKGKGLVD
jgi:hypothetical protein